MTRTTKYSIKLATSVAPAEALPKLATLMFKYEPHLSRFVCITGQFRHAFEQISDKTTTTN